MKTVQAIAIDQLLANLPEYYSTFDRDLVIRAYEVASEAHSEQKRQSGEPYINHCVAVASILSDMKMPAEVVAAGLLHDTVEDTHITLKELREQFGEIIANLVDGVTKLDSLPRVSRSDHFGNEIEPLPPTQEQVSKRKKQIAIEAIRKTFLAMN
ncbi:MAG: HD domain-containing protein, partial [Chloroflexi bacterium]|nr:HD domain-containing protein [Chloroflexota bacterium]